MERERETKGRKRYRERRERERVEEEERATVMVERQAGQNTRRGRKNHPYRKRNRY